LEAGIYPIGFTATLVSYPNVIYSLTYTVEIKICVMSGYTYLTTPTTPQNYIISSPAITIAYPTFT